MADKLPVEEGSKKMTVSISGSKSDMGTIIEGAKLDGRSLSAFFMHAAVKEAKAIIGAEEWRNSMRTEAARFPSNLRKLAKQTSTGIEEILTMLKLFENLREQQEVTPSDEDPSASTSPYP